jgi:hypothetical protein
MKSFVKVAAQGEITIIRVGDVPKKAVKLDGKPLVLEAGKLIIGHSETGHHHVLERPRGATVTVLDKAPEGMRILHAILEEPNKLIHERGHDTHETIDLAAGEYHFRIAREFDHYAELARQSAD